MSMRKIWFSWLMTIGTSTTVIVLFFVFDDKIRNTVHYGKVVYNIPSVMVNDDVHAINCKYLFENNKTEIVRAKFRTLHEDDYGATADRSAYIRQGTKHCSRFIQNRGYVVNVTAEERQFPVAFSILVYKDAHQAERLLRSIYRPSNYYCVHVDGKAASGVHESMRKLTECFGNVKMASRTLEVIWGEYSVLEAELVCIRDLLRHRKWKYFINLTGQEYPLKTNLQLVRILKSYNGANDIDGTISRYSDNFYRWWFAGTAPHGIRPVIGSVHIVANRQFVDYAVHHPVARDLLAWVKRTFIPDETFFSTLNHNPQLEIPGTYKGVPETNPDTKPFLARYKLWDNGFRFHLDNCQGKYVNDICIFGIGDLPKLKGRKELFANKFHIDFEPIVYECMETSYFETVKQEMEGGSHFDYSYYKSVGFVHNQVKLKTSHHQNNQVKSNISRHLNSQVDQAKDITQPE